MKAVNLLPSELRGAAPAPAKPADRHDSGGPGAYILLGALALCVAGLAGWVLTGNSIVQREAELAALAERQQAAQARAAQLKPYADFVAVATERFTTVQQLAGSRFRWELALRDISYALPTDVVVKSVDASIGSGAGGTSPLRGAIESPAIELTGCATDQRSVARMMARLRAVNGVTRVSLSRSAKSEEQGPGAVAPISGTGAADAQPEGCAGKNPPDFELVMFFESQAALSAEPTVTSAAQAAAQPATGTTTPATGTTTPATGTTTPATGTTTPATGTTTTTPSTGAATPTPTPDAATSSTGTTTSTQGAVSP